MCLLAMHFSSLVKYVFKYLPIFKLGCLALSCNSSLNILDTVLFQSYHLQIFSPTLWLAFYFLNSVFQRENIFNFDEVQFTNFWFYRSCFWCTKELSCLIHGHKDFLFLFRKFCRFIS